MWQTRYARYVRQAQRGITLLELLTVLGIIAAVAGIGVQVYTGVTDDAEEALVRSEMRQIASAIQRFRADTGYFPKDGPFAGDTSGNALAPANLAQLFVQPQDGGGAILPFDAASDTGWNGPYIAELQNIDVRVGDNLTADGAGNITAGNLVLVRGIGDTYSATPNGANNLFEWLGRDIDGDGIRDRVAELGRPYLYFIDAGAGANVPGCTPPCLVSFGPGGNFGDADDIVINIGLSN